MQRYSLQEARKYISRALTRLNRARGLNIVLFDLEHTDLMGWNFIKAHLYDKTLNYKFDAMLNEFIFTREDAMTVLAMTVLDTQANIKNKNLDDETKTIIRIAYTIWRDWKETRNADVD